MKARRADIRPEHRARPVAAEHAADPRQARRRRQAALEHGPANRAASARLRHRAKGRARRRDGNDFHGARDRTVPGCRASGASRAAVTRMGRPLSRSRSIRASANAWRYMSGAIQPAVAMAFARSHRRRAPTALASATTCRCRSLSIFSEPRRSSLSPSCSSPCSFVVLARTTRRPRLDLLASAPGKIIAHPGVILLLKLVAAGLFVVTVVAGFIGDQNPYRNIAPTLVWIIFWVGLAYVSAFVGDLWALINPWRTIFDAAAWLYRRVCSRREFPYRLPYPAALGVWPAFAAAARLLLDRARLSSPAVPAHIACFAAGYSILTWTGMVAVRARHLDAARRGVLRRVRHLRALRAD